MSKEPTHMDFFSYLAEALPALTEADLSRSWDRSAKTPWSSLPTEAKLEWAQVANLTRLVRRLGQEPGEPMTTEAFAKFSASIGGKWCNTLANSYFAGRKEYLEEYLKNVKSSKAAGTEQITQPQEIPCTSNGNDYHPPEPTKPAEELAILPESAYLRADLEEAKQKIASLQELVRILQEIAGQNCPSDWLSEGDDLNPGDFAGSVSDAFEVGRTEGETLLARSLLEVINAQTS